MKSNSWQCCGYIFTGACKTCPHCGKGKLKVGRPLKFETASVVVAVRLSETDVKILNQEFGKAGAGIEELVKRFTKRKKRE